MGLNAHSEAEFVNIIRRSTTHDGTETIGRSVMMRLNRGDMVFMVNEAGVTTKTATNKKCDKQNFKI